MPSDRGLCAIVLAAVVLAYAPSLGGGWVWDDHAWAEQPADVASVLRTLGSIWRPLGMLPIQLVHAVADGPLLHRLWSLAVHLVAVTAVGAVARGAGARPALAWFGAALFGLHPGASEPVAWMSAQTEAVPAALTLVGWAALGAGRPVAAGLLWALTPFGKEAWLLLPLGGALWCRATGLRAWSTLGSAAAGGAAYLGLRWMIAPEASAVTFPVGIVEVFGALGGTALRGLELLFVPASADAVARFVSAPIVGGVVTVAVLAAIAASRRRPWLGAVLLPLPVLAPNALAAAINGVQGDRYYYLPIAGIAVALALGVEALLVRRPDLGAARAWSLALVLPLVLGAATGLRAREWEDDETLYRASLALDPSNPSSAFGLAYHLHVRKGDCARAEPLYRQAMAAEPRAVSGLQACLQEAGRNEEIIALAPLASTPAATANVIRALVALGRVDAAATAARAATQVYPADVRLLTLAGNVLGRAGQLDASEEAFRAALLHAPNDDEAAAGLGAVANARARAAAPLPADAASATHAPPAPPPR